MYQSTPDVLTQHVLDRLGCPLHYWTGGEGPLVVLMHGATMDHRMFNPQVAPLIEAGYRVLICDVRGHGQSQPIGAGFSMKMAADDLIAILDAEGVEQAIIGGQSMGGLIAQEAYRHYQERFRAMIVIGSTPIAKAYPKRDVMAMKASSALMKLWPYGSFTRTVAKSTAETPEAQRYAHEAINQMSKQDFLTVWQGVTDSVGTEGFPDMTIEVPLLLVHGAQDNSGTIRRDAPGWAERDPDVMYAVIPNAGHNANQDNPEVTNQLILEFLNTLRRRQI